jgi:hypothetical protein
MAAYYTLMIAGEAVLVHLVTARPATVFKL